MEKTPPLPSISCNGNGVGFPACAVTFVSPELAEALSAATGGVVREVEEADEVGDELSAGSAAVAVQANAEAKASEVIRVQ
ncbi:MAG: hypothetical protein ABSD29_08110 [Verrucomicrobiota bacterium]